MQHSPIDIETHPLRRARIEQNLTYRRFAEIAGLSWRHVEPWERGESIPSLTNAEVIMRILPGFESPEQLRLACLNWQRRHVPEKVRLSNRNRGPLVRGLEAMSTTEERLDEIERLIAQLQKDQQELGRRDRLHDEHITIILSQIVTLVPEVDRLHERLDVIDGRLDEQSRELASHSVLLNQHTALLQQILAKLP